MLYQWNGPALESQSYEEYEGVAKLINTIRIQYDNTKEAVPIEKIKKAISQYGAVSISYKAQDHRSNHVYFNSKGANYGASHAVTIVGWDDSISKDLYKPKSASRDGGWIVKNSWGTYAGLNGYFYLSYDSPIQSILALEYAKNDAYENNYYYDGVNTRFSSVFDQKNVAAIFQVKKASYNKKEKLKAINFAFEGKNADIKLQIYKNVSVNDLDCLSSPNNPTKGELVLTKDLHYNESCIYTVDLDNEIELAAGSHFSVVLQIVKSES